MALHPDHDLLQAHLDGTLAARDRQLLETRLQREPALSEALMMLAREEAICTEWTSASAATDMVVCEAELVVAGPVGPATKRLGHRWVRRAAIVAVSAAAVLVLAFLGSRVAPPGFAPSGTVLALLENVEGEVMLISPEGSERAAEAGQALYAGQEIRTGEEGSSTVIRMLDSRLVLASETRIRLGPEPAVSDAGWGPLVFVTEGIVNAELAPRPDGRPIIISSPLAELRGSKGRFSFASLPEKTRVESDAGTARVTRKSDGKSVDVPRGKFAIASHDEPLTTLDLPARVTGAKRTFTDTAPIVGLFFEPEGLSLCSCAGDAIKRWELNSGRVVSTIRPQPRKKALRGFAASRDGRLFAVNPAEDKQVKLFDALSGLERASYKGMKRFAASALSPDGRFLAVSWSAGKEAHEVRLYDTALGLDRALHTGHTGAVQNLGFSPRGRYLTTIADRSIKVWDANSFALIKATTKLAYEPRCLAYSPDEKLLAVGDRKGVIHLLETATGVERSSLAGHLREVTALAFAPDGTTLVSAATDGTARVWNVEAGREITTLKASNQTINAVACSNDGATIATGGADRKIMFWDAPGSSSP